MENLFPIFFFFFIVGALPPARWGLRITVLLALLLTLGLTTSPNPDVSDRDTTLFLALPLLCGPLLAGVAVRHGITIALRPQVPSPADAVPKDERRLAAADRILLVGIAVCLGCFAFRALALQLQASAGGLSLHMAVAAVALLVSAALWQSRLRSISLGAGLLVAALSLDGGLRYPDLILTDAKRLHPGQPRCLMLAPSLQPPRIRADLMALTMTKDRTSPSAALLLIETKTEPRLYRWSLRARGFVSAPDRLCKITNPLCSPTEATLSLP